MLIGDHRQLRPVIKNQVAKRLGMECSLFERHSGNAIMLDTQYRMVGYLVMSFTAYLIKLTSATPELCLISDTTNFGCQSLLIEPSVIDFILYFYLPLVFEKTAGGIVLGSVAVSAVSTVSADVSPYISVAIKASFLKLGMCNIC